jgi:predicted GIY-YIG superfamily endonuclease
MAQEGVVYLIHLSRLHRHARHYLGWTQKNVEQRLAEHRAGRGSLLPLTIVSHMTRSWTRSFQCGT